MLSSAADGLLIALLLISCRLSHLPVQRSIFQSIGMERSKVGLAAHERELKCFKGQGEREAESREKARVGIGMRSF